MYTGHNNIFRMYVCMYVKEIMDDIFIKYWSQQEKLMMQNNTLASFTCKFAERAKKINMRGKT